MFGILPGLYALLIGLLAIAPSIGGAAGGVPAHATRQRPLGARGCLPYPRATRRCCAPPAATGAAATGRSRSRGSCGRGGRVSVAGSIASTPLSQHHRRKKAVDAIAAVTAITPGEARRRSHPRAAGGGGGGGAAAPSAPRPPIRCRPPDRRYRWSPATNAASAAKPTRPRCEDHSNATVTDRATGLTWERKCEDCAAPHGVSARHQWTSPEHLGVLPGGALRRVLRTAARAGGRRAAPRASEDGSGQVCVKHRLSGIAARRAPLSRRPSGAHRCRCARGRPHGAEMRRACRRGAVVTEPPVTEDRVNLTRLADAAC